MENNMSNTINRNKPTPPPPPPPKLEAPGRPDATKVATDKAVRSKTSVADTFEKKKVNDTASFQQKPGVTRQVEDHAGLDSGKNAVGLGQASGQAKSAISAQTTNAEPRPIQRQEQAEQLVPAAPSRPKGLFDRINDFADSVGDRLRNAGQNIQQAEQLLRPVLPQGLSDSVRQLGQGVENAGRNVADAPENALTTLDQTGQRVQQFAEQGRQVLQDVRQEVERRVKDGIDTGREIIRDGIDTGREVINNGIDRLQQGVNDVVETGRDIAQGVRDFANVEKQISQLDSDGDKFTIALGGSASAEGVKVAGKGEIEVKRSGEPPQYTVSYGGEVGAGVAGEIGGKLGLKASVDAEALLKAGGKLQMTFDNPQDAARAVEIIGRQAAVNAAGSAIGNGIMPGVGNLVGGAVADRLLGPSEADRQFLADNTTGIELNGGLAAKAAMGMGIRLDESLNVGGVGAKANASVNYAMNIQFPKRDDNGAVTQGARVTFKQEIAGGIAGEAALGFKDKDSGTKGKLGAGVNAGVQAKLTISETHQLPTSVTMDNLIRNPVDTLRDLNTQTQRIDSSVNLSLRGNAHLAGTGGGGQLDLKLGVNPQQLSQSGAIQQLFSGDPQAALRTLGDNVDIKWRGDSFTQHGINVEPKLSVMGFGLGIDAQYQREDHTTQFQGQSTASQFADQFNDLLSQLLPPTQTPALNP
jgi:hypothetical protein